ncbi:MAG: transposase [bacterium]|nr:transposase [bacterium]
MSELFKNKYTIKSSRLSNYDYSQNGMYFVTICTKDKEYFFGEVKNGGMVLNDVGKMADKYWREIPAHFPFVRLDEFVVMPNHVHGIVEIAKNIDASVETQNFASLQGERGNKFGPQSKNLASIIRGFKVGVKKYTTKNEIYFQWQPRYYDQIIRNEISLNKIREYIQINPQMWERDKNSLENIFM